MKICDLKEFLLQTEHYYPYGNDVSGANRDVNRLWDVQSKGVKSLNPKKIGEAQLKEMYLNDEDRTYSQIDNFKFLSFAD